MTSPSANFTSSLRKEIYLELRHSTLVDKKPTAHKKVQQHWSVRPGIKSLVTLSSKLFTIYAWRDTGEPAGNRKKDEATPLPKPLSLMLQTHQGERLTQPPHGVDTQAHHPSPS